MRGEPLKMITAQRPLTEKEIDEAIKELNKNTGLITSLTYYMKKQIKEAVSRRKTN